jgi:hypothetical protein
MHDVTSVEIVAPFRLRLVFDDGTSGEVDVRRLLPLDGVFEPLNDPEFFARASVNPDLGTVVWPNGADLDPEVLHGIIAPTGS